MSHGTEEPNSQVERLRKSNARFLNDHCRHSLGSWEERSQQQYFHHFSTDSGSGRHLIDGTTSQAYDIQLPHSRTALMPLKTGGPGSGMEEIRDDFQQHVGHDPETYGLAAGDQVCEADLPHHPTEQD